jgi:hypothetical protein
MFRIMVLLLTRILLVDAVVYQVLVVYVHYTTVQVPFLLFTVHTSTLTAQIEYPLQIYILFKLQYCKKQTSNILHNVYKTLFSGINEFFSSASSLFPTTIPLLYRAAGTTTMIILSNGEDSCSTVIDTSTRMPGTMFTHRRIMIGTSQKVFVPAPTVLGRVCIESLDRMKHLTMVTVRNKYV